MARGNRSGTYAVCKGCSGWRFHHCIDGKQCRGGKPWPAADLAAAAATKNYAYRTQYPWRQNQGRQHEDVDQAPRAIPGQSREQKQLLLQSLAKDLAGEGCFTEEFVFPWSEPPPASASSDVPTVPPTAKQREHDAAKAFRAAIEQASKAQAAWGKAARRFGEAETALEKAKARLAEDEAIHKKAQATLDSAVAEIKNARAAAHAEEAARAAEKPSAAAGEAEDTPDGNQDQKRRRTEHPKQSAGEQEAWEGFKLKLLSNLTPGASGDVEPPSDPGQALLWVQQLVSELHKASVVKPAAEDVHMEAGDSQQQQQQAGGDPVPAHAVPLGIGNARAAGPQGDAIDPAAADKEVEALRRLQESEHRG